ncbi:MAG: zinc ribbon domain-containing protein, partial [Anaerolineales bacterium]|nr:zinc ribbon domain-containing protein [Anaerolineales bacterium]
LALLVLVGFYISRPLFEKSATAFSPAEHEYSTLLAERDQILDAIRELDMDNSMGKITPEVYNGQRTALLQQGADILRQMDALEAADPDLVIDQQKEGVISPPPEEELQVYQKPTAVAQYDEELENLVSARRQSRTGKSAGFCAKCGHPVQENDRFCAHCGATV